MAEAAIAELKRELMSLAAQNTQLDQALLSLAVRNMNSRIRSGNLSASDRFLGKELLTDKPISIDEQQLRSELKERRERQHKTKGTPNNPVETFSVGDLVMLKELGRLDKPRKLYIVNQLLDDGNLKIRKSERQWRLMTYRVKPSQISNPKPTYNDNTQPQRSSKDVARTSIQQQYRNKKRGRKTKREHRKIKNLLGATNKKQ